MQSFVHGRAASPQQAPKGSHIKPDRQAIAANAKVSMKKGPTAHPTQKAQVSGLPSRGLKNVQISSAVLSQPFQHRHPVQGIKADPYDTDAESIDTTVNQSVVHTDERQPNIPHYQQRSNFVHLGSEEAIGHSQDGSEQDEAEDDYAFTQEDVEFLEREGQTHLSRPDAITYLLRARSSGLPTVEGDSYPTTTDGETTDWARERDVASEGPGQDDPLPPSRPEISGGRPQAQQFKYDGPNDTRNTQALQSSTTMFKQSARLRDQQRTLERSVAPPGLPFQSANGPLHSSQLPSYSQASHEPADVHASNLRNRTNHRVAFMQEQSVPHQRQDLGQSVAVPVAPNAYSAPISRTSANDAHAVPHVRQYRLGEGETVQNATVDPQCDYDLKALDTMSYDALKNESFDTNPRMTGHSLSTDMRQKPLIERLEHVQKNLDPAKQSAFFRNLPTQEWEDAGDWFLDQFSSIIQRSKQARQQKRKVAQCFEDEIERHYKHVSKKQHQVAEAMKKMQAQGEGLVPRSPRPSKSPKPRKH
ncbi:hypothetical protein ACEQ8H_002901 [Pleosporales sp. CAS-2024a]